MLAAPGAGKPETNARRHWSQLLQAMPSMVIRVYIKVTYKHIPIDPIAINLLNLDPNSSPQRAWTPGYEVDLDANCFPAYLFPPYVWHSFHMLYSLFLSSSLSAPHFIRTTQRDRQVIHRATARRGIPYCHDQKTRSMVWVVLIQSTRYDR